MSSPGPERRMTIWQHISEFRQRIFNSVLALAAGTAVAYCFRTWIYDMLIYPLERAAPGIKLNYFNPTEPFMVYLRLSLFAGLVLASPVVLYQLWAFIAPALTKSERRIALLLLPLVVLLFVGGVAFIYFLLLPTALGFLLGYAHQMSEAELGQERYFGFVTAMCLVGGVLFELPAVLGVAGWLGFVTPRWLWRNAGWALVVLMTIAAILTPTGDAFNMLALTTPLMLLYLASIGVVWAIQRGGAGNRQLERRL